MKSIPTLKTIYDNHFNTNPKKFIELLSENKEKDLDLLIDVLEKYVAVSNNVLPIDNISSTSDLFNATRYQILRYNELSIRGGKTYAK